MLTGVAKTAQILWMVRTLILEAADELLGKSGSGWVMGDGVDTP